MEEEIDMMQRPFQNKAFNKYLDDQRLVLKLKTILIIKAFIKQNLQTLAAFRFLLLV